MTNQRKPDYPIHEMFVNRWPPRGFTNEPHYEGGPPCHVGGCTLDSLVFQYVFLQPAMFFQNFIAAWAKMNESGVYGEPWSTETRFTRVDYRDVSEVAAIALTEDRLLLEGEMEATFRGKKSLVRAGDTINSPANAPHQFHNSSSKPVRLLCICSPAGQEKFFQEVGIPSRLAPPLLPSSTRTSRSSSWRRRRR